MNLSCRTAVFQTCTGISKGEFVLLKGCTSPLISPVESVIDPPLDFSGIIAPWVNFGETAWVVIEEFWADDAGGYIYLPESVCVSTKYPKARNGGSLVCLVASSRFPNPRTSVAMSVHPQERRARGNLGDIHLGFFDG